MDSDIKNIQDKFLRFLMDRNVSTFFCAGLMSSHSDISLNEYLSCTEPESYLLACTRWKDTQDGLDHWAGLNKEWNEILYKLRGGL